MDWQRGVAAAWSVVGLGLKYWAPSAFAASAGFAAWALSTAPALAADRGRRGEERARALARGGAFAMFEPIVRLCAVHIAALKVPKLRALVARRLERAGDYKGLSPDEYLALVLLAAGFFGLVGAVLAVVLDGSVTLGGTGAGLGGGLLPIVRVEAAATRRARTITRDLPAAIYLVAMCMSAGLDFPGALRLVTQGAALDHDDVAAELRLVLQSLELGQLRQQALLSLSRRTPTPAVCDFVSAVVQAEERGNPLGPTLLVQARTLNLKRTLAAEEAAARAAVLMLGPLMLLMGCILIILMGPFIVTGGGL